MSNGVIRRNIRFSDDNSAILSAIKKFGAQSYYRFPASGTYAFDEKEIANIRRQILRLSESAIY